MVEQEVNALIQITLTDWIKIIAVFLAAIGLFLNAWQQQKSTKQRRTEHVSDVLWKIYDDKDLSDIYYQIEYCEFKYSDKFHGSDDERKLDKLISIFDILAKQYFLGLIKIEDIDLVSYEYLVIFQNSEVNRYFSFLDDWFEQRGIRNPPFEKFRELGRLVENNHFRN